MKLTLTPEELVPIVREHLERKLNLTLSGLNIVDRPSIPLTTISGDAAPAMRGFVFEIEVQPKAEQP